MNLPIDTALALMLTAGVSWLLVLQGLAKRQLMWRKPRRPPLAQPHRRAKAMARKETT